MSPDEIVGTYLEMFYMGYCVDNHIFKPHLTVMCYVVFCLMVQCIFVWKYACHLISSLYNNNISPRQSSQSNPANKPVALIRKQSPKTDKFS